MKHKLAIGAVVLGLAISAISAQAALNFAGINNVQFNANGDSFQLNPTTGSIATPQFDFTGSGLGWKGWITGAPWAVNMAGLTTTTVGGITYQQAPVIGGGVLNIFDGLTTLSATVNWIQIHSISGGQGGISDSLAINLTGITYTGLNAELLALAAGHTGNLNLTFQFSGAAPNLNGLFDGSSNVTQGSYSGSISGASPVPEPATLLAGALILLPFGASTIRILRKNRAAGSHALVS